MAQPNPFERIAKTLTVGDKTLKYYSLKDLQDPRVASLPYSIRVLLESALRNCNEFDVTSNDVNTILSWKEASTQDVEIAFKPARVILQDFTGVPAVVDLAGMRDQMVRLGGDPQKINPLVPVDLVIDHSVQVDYARLPDARERNEEKEFERNYERFQFLKWGAKAFNNMLIVPPGSGIVHQVNLEYLARVVFAHDGMAYPDSVVGTDSHTTMVNGLGVVGWGVGGIEAEAVMLGQTISMVLPKVVGFKLTGELRPEVTATDLVLTCTQMLRKRGVVGQFVEFFGPGVRTLSLADRATVANMSPEYGATMGYFPIDDVTMAYLRQTGRDAERCELVEKYLKEQGLFADASQPDATYSGELMELDLSSVESCVAGPKRPHDRVVLKKMKTDFQACLPAPTGFKGFAVAPDRLAVKSPFQYEGQTYELSHGSIVIAAITSCTNTSNPDVMLGAALLAKKAVEKGLHTLPYIKTSLSPGSGVVREYMRLSGLQPYLDALGFNLAGYGCMTCIGNSGELPEPVSEAINKEKLVAAAVLSGNRNFEGRVHALTLANYLMSPLLVVAYALAGRVDIDFENEPIANDNEGKPVFLRDIWPSRHEIQAVVASSVLPTMFQEVYQRIAQGTPRWNALNVAESSLYSWNDASTYIHDPPFFKGMPREPEALKDISNAYVLLNLGDSITTDHISPAGSIARTSPAAAFLQERGVKPADFNTYGSRRGNDEVMARGTFANNRLFNKMLPKPEPKTVHVPTGEVLPIFDAAMRYMKAGQDVIVFGGAEYGTGSSRDWAAKGPYLLGIKAVIAISFERIHRSNLIGMGILPLQFHAGENAESLQLDAKDQYTIELQGGDIHVAQDIVVKSSSGKQFTVKCRLDTEVEIEYFKNGGVLKYMLRKLVAQ